MILEIETRLAVCRIQSGSRAGTGFLVAEDCVLTARHCVLDAITKNAGVVTYFYAPGAKEIQIEGTVLAENQDNDLCIIKLKEKVTNNPLRLATNILKEGVHWRSFGFPETKPLLGHRITGTIETLHEIESGKIDVDLSVASESRLQSYRGLSGGPVVVGGYAVAVLRERMDNSLGALSVEKFSEFLKSNNIGVTSKNPKPRRDVSVAERYAFQAHFEINIASSAGKYVFLEGPHGIGKTTFCRQFSPSHQMLRHIGTFCIKESADSNIAVNSQASVLYDWFADKISSLVTGRSARQEMKNYAQMVQDIEALLIRASEHLANSNVIGTFIIDGLNEVAAFSDERLKLFIGLLPANIPPNISIVLSSPTFYSLSGPLGSRFDPNKIVKLPELSKDSCAHFAHSKLEGERKNNNDLIRIIADKSTGNPLYLNYLIRYANSNPHDSDLDEFPVLDGTIERYYESLWQGIAADGHAVNLLGIISYLRSSVPTAVLQLILDPSEQVHFIPTLSRLQHLLQSSDATALYHDSFRLFILNKTTAISSTICARLATFCGSHLDIDYCRMNYVYHLLSSNSNDRIKSLSVCSQGWVDECVMLSVSPDTLMDDIENVLRTALEKGSYPDTIKLLLLKHRVSFRYNTLFAQSAELVAQALISLGKPSDALQHALRHGNLIVGGAEAMRIAWMLIESNYSDEAEKLLDTIIDNCISLYSAKSLSLKSFTSIGCIHVLATLFLRGCRNIQMSDVVYVQNRLIRMLAESLQGSDDEVLEYCINKITGIPNWYFLVFLDTYSSNDDLMMLAGEQIMPRLRMLRMRLDLVSDGMEAIEIHGMPYFRDSHSKVIEDIGSLVREGENLERIDMDYVLDALIQIGAPAALVNKILSGNPLASPGEFKIRDKNGVDADIASANRFYAFFRLQSLAAASHDALAISKFNSVNWEASIENAIKYLAIIDGKARISFTANNAIDLESYWNEIRENLLPVLEITLLERIEWERSYAIPETVLPFVYRRLALLVFECFPKNATVFLEWLTGRCLHQFGVYTEGFRSSVFEIIESACRCVTDQDSKMLLFEIAKSLKKHLINCVENRHEIVPELLRLIPLFVRLDANQEAEATYLEVLKNSMGPSWYKEDQFGLLNTALEALPGNVNASKYFAEIAGLLEKASGEMTFQRSVRYDKSNLIGFMASRKHISSAIRYFQQQTCGEPDQLFNELSSTLVDRVSKFIGNRHPGCALDEQHSILQLVDGLTCEWRLRWAILEVYQLGDPRHVSYFASVFGELVNQWGIAENDFLDMRRRILQIITSDLPGYHQQEFVSTFLDKLIPSFRERFPELASKYAQKAPVEETHSRARVKRNTETEPIDGDHDNTRKDFFLPGIFGRSNAFDGAIEVIKDCEREIHLGNLKIAKEKLIAYLRKVQQGEWTIWKRPDESTQSASSMLRTISQSSSTLVQDYCDLVISENYAYSWLIASYLINETKTISTEEECIAALEAVIEHIKIMVGDAQSQAESFNAINATESLDNNVTLFKFIEWLANHPKWIRREKAGEVLAWLATSWMPFRQYLADAIYNSDCYNARNISYGLLEVLSRDNHALIVDMLKTLDVNRLREVPLHAFRICALLQIARNVARSGSDDVSGVIEDLQSLFRSSKIILPTDTGVVLPEWAYCIKKQWDALSMLGLTSKSLLNDMQSNLAGVCSPYDILEMYQLEKAVSMSFFENEKASFNRWTARVINSLNCALVPYLALDQVEDILRIFSPINPSLPCMHRTDSDSQFISMLNKLSVRDYLGMIQNGGEYYLHYLEIGEAVNVKDKNEIAGKYHTLEIIAVIVSAKRMQRSYFLPEVATTFTSRELPKTNGKSYETCATLIPSPVFMGGFTATIPFDSFLHEASTTIKACSRKTWRNERSGNFETFGRALYEGCSLAIDSKSLQLNKDSKLAWIISLDNSVVAMTDTSGNELY